MSTRFLIVVIIALLTAACQPSDTTEATLPPLPTVTVGQSVSGALSAENVSVGSGAAVSNPATAVASSVQTTATPDYSACPSTAFEARLQANPPDREAAVDAILSYLNAGGSPEDLFQDMDTVWDAVGETGYMRNSDDLTGEGSVDIALGYTAPDGIGTLLIIGCEDGRFVSHYETTTVSEEPPEIVWLEDVNNTPPAEVVFSSRVCREAELCEYATQLLSWNARLGRFVNLLDDNLISLQPPSVQDMDNDDVAELVINMTSNGTSATGPLRTGVNIYDWDGASYTLSIIQLNSPRYRIQVVHQGDRAFSQQNWEEAARLYELALSNEDLRYWFNDGPETVVSYAFYRLILAQAVINDPALPETITRLNLDFAVTEEEPLEDQPVFVTMAYTFLNTLQDTADLHSACEDVLDVVEGDETALELLNRYGDRSPQYTALDLCPF